MKLILAMVRMQKSIVVAVTSSGIAATLLPGGGTAYSTFKLPLNLTPTCNISKNSDQGQLMKCCQLIVWDECTVAHKGAFDVLNRTLQDIRGCEAPMGGVTLLLSGNFRQTLPVIPKGMRADEVQACLKSSLLWRHVRSLTLTINMRARLLGDQMSANFASDILKLGNGKVPLDADGELDVHPFVTPISPLAELSDKVFPRLKDNYLNHEWLSERSVLVPKNVTVTKLNDQLLQSLPGAPFAYKSVDTMVEANESMNFPTEFLNSLDPLDLPPHLLCLKVGTPVMFLRNRTHLVVK
uniref:ATP-dependent DNA helicase n=2 Tax=Octopus bimaculoides TaxID=37653 RepID=A0A0L8FGD5_OCTBM